MASSDEEGEILPEHVTDYYFVDDKENLVSFAILPLLWTEGEVLDGPKTKVFMSGDADNGLQKVYKSVIAWKLELSFVKPVVLVLSKGRKWITLQKPRKSYENTIRTILITIHWLHLIKKNPELSRQFVWNHLRQAIRFYDTEPSENDLSQHMLLINQTVKRDEDLMKSKYVVTFLENPSTGEPSHEGIQKIVKTEFIVNEDEDDVVNSDGEEVVLNSIFDTVCSICDNGGTVLCCEGSCLRSFHPTEADGSDSLCQSLGFLNHVQVEALPSFLCKNCLYKQHQCYACGKLGSSDTSAGQEVFSCSSATCGHFYHPECVARLLHMGNENEALKLQETIAAGKSFTCPMHKCYVCKQSEDAAVHGLHLAICRRCPQAYHRKCLPKMITLEFTMDKSLLQRAWDGLLPENRILIYCMDHKIDQVLGTPSRDHLKFPDLEGKEKKDKLEVLSCKGKVTDSIQSMSSENFAANRPLMKKAKLFQKFGSDIEAFNENTDEKCSRHDLDILKKPNIGETGKNYLEKNLSSDIERCFKTDKSKFLPTKGNVKLNMGSAIGTLGELSSRNRKIRNTVQTLPMVKPLVALDMEKGITALMEHSTSSFNVEEFKKRRQIPATYACNPSKMLDKTITFGRVEASVRAVRAALEKLEAGGSIDDAKTICGPEVLKQIALWKGKLQVFLAPFLHGMRYTSFGRHFTKLEKLKEIVDRLCWYVQNGDTIVDFSCGSNDFSCLMKEKLENMEKFCSFKNYDLFRPKNDFNFEQRDWMSINLNELPDGSQLIMGLNPPFGFKASLANMFINKALQFRPKLIVLIVPEETRQLDREAPYDLVWEDDRILSGKSFYLPGSVDVDDKQLEQWNLKSPPLYLWSRHDWTARHKAIAQEHNHIYNAQEEIHKKEKNDNEIRFNHVMEEHNDGYGDFFRDMQECLGLSSISDGVPKVNNNFEPGEVRGVIPPSEHREGYFPGHSNSFWENDDMTLWKTDSTCIDMEISTP